MHDIFAILCTRLMRTDIIAIYVQQFCPWITYTSIQPQPTAFTYIDIYKICVDTCIMHKVHGTIPSKEKDTCTQRAVIIHSCVTALPPCAQAGSRAHSHISPLCTANVCWHHEFQTIHVLTFKNRLNILWVLIVLTQFNRLLHANNERLADSANGSPEFPSYFKMVQCTHHVRWSAPNYLTSLPMTFSAATGYIATIWDCYCHTPICVQRPKISKCMVIEVCLHQSRNSGLLNQVVRLPFYPGVLWCMRHCGIVKVGEAMPILVKHHGHRWVQNLSHLYHLGSCFTLVAQFLVFYGSGLAKNTCSSRPHHLPRVMWM